MLSAFTGESIHALGYTDTWGPLWIGSSDILQKKGESGLTVHFHQSVLGEHIRKTLHFARARHDSIWMMLNNDASDKWFIKIKTLIFLMSHSVTLASATCMQGIPCAIHILFLFVHFTSDWYTSRPSSFVSSAGCAFLPFPPQKHSRNGAVGCVWRIRRVRVMFYGLPVFFFFHFLSCNSEKLSHRTTMIQSTHAQASSRAYACAQRMHVSYFKNLTLFILFIRNLPFYVCIFQSLNAC